MIASQKAGIGRRITETNAKLERVTIAQVFAHLNEPRNAKTARITSENNPPETCATDPGNLALLGSLGLVITVR